VKTGTETTATAGGGSSSVTPPGAGGCGTVVVVVVVGVVVVVVVVVVVDDGGVPPAVQCDTTNCGLPPVSGRVAEAVTTLEPASVTMSHFDTLPECGCSSARFVTVVPSLKVADIVAGPAVPSG
jgi:hypothetical protein